MHFPNLESMKIANNFINNSISLNRCYLPKVQFYTLEYAYPWQFSSFYNLS